MSQPWKRDRELVHLHPIVREKVRVLLEKLSAEGIPFQLFEGFRSPQRQQYLYEQGRTRPGGIVTYAGPWGSYHQYGLGADMVLFENGSWSWDTSGEKSRWWERLHQLAREHGLEPLSWEKPHLQPPGLSITDLQAGEYPQGGDLDWAECLQAAISSWSGYPPSPPGPPLIPERPPLEEWPTPVLEEDDIPSAGSADWHSYFGGQEWRFDDSGVYIRGHANGREPLRTTGKPVTCGMIWTLFAHEILGAAQKYRIPPAIIMMVIAAEVSDYRKYGFTGPKTFRWESQVKVKDVVPPLKGDYSAGPMQTLAATARWLVRQQGLAYNPFTVAPVLERPTVPPTTLPLYDPAISIDIGTAFIKQYLDRTGNDPILAAATYNAGGIYKSVQNAWHLRTYGNHLDRAAKWYGDACAVLKKIRE
jgi:peptidoglycan L-alanyl-D-glutamate endopeptidase CwlK